MGRRRVASRRACAGARSSASRWPTSSAARAFARSSSRSIRACSCRGRRPRRWSRPRSGWRRVQASWTSGPAAVRSRSRSSTSARTWSWSRPTSIPTRSRSRGRTRRGWTSTCCSSRATCSIRSRAVRRRCQQPAVRRRAGVARDSLRRSPPRTAPRAARRARTGSRFFVAWSRGRGSRPLRRSRSGGGAGGGGRPISCAKRVRRSIVHRDLAGIERVVVGRRE